MSSYTTGADGEVISKGLGCFRISVKQHEGFTEEVIRICNLGRLRVGVDDCPELIQGVRANASEIVESSLTKQGCCADIRVTGCGEGGGVFRYSCRVITVEQGMVSLCHTHLRRRGESWGGDRGRWACRGR